MLITTAALVPSLIAAGPLLDVDGEGMTIPAVENEQLARRVAEQDDQSVRDGVLIVTVRPWQVRHPAPNIRPEPVARYRD